jgi:ABC-2 type transport system ATP-binding protein
LGPGTHDETMDHEAVIVDGLVMRYGSVLAVDGASFSARAGEITVLLGPNGAGKTSTVEHLEGYRPASAGRATVLGRDPLRDHRWLTRKVGVMLQSGGIPTGIRPLEVLRQYAGFFDDPLDPEQLLRTVGLDHRRATAFRRLSGGEQQRLSLALALVGRPLVVFLDEPTAGVDLDGRDRIRATLQSLRDQGVCVVLTTHDLVEAERCADRIVIMDRGRVVADGTPADLVAARDDDRLRFGAPAGLDLESLADAVGFSVAEESPGEYRVEAPPTPANVASVTAWLARHDLQLSDLRAGRQRLDDVFRALTARTDDADDDAVRADPARGRRGRRSRR